MHTCIHPTTIFNLKTKRKRTYIQLASSSACLVVHQIKQTREFMGDLGSGHLRCGRDECKENVKTAAQELSHANPYFMNRAGYDGEDQNQKEDNFCYS